MWGWTMLLSGGSRGESASRLIQVVAESWKGRGVIKVKVTGSHSACEWSKVRQELRALDASSSSLDAQAAFGGDASGKHVHNPGHGTYSIYGALISKPRVRFSVSMTHTSWSQ